MQIYFYDPNTLSGEFQEISMCTCKNPWISSAVDAGRNIPDPRVQVAISIYDLLCTFCREK
jgi:hypothetical protein